MKLAFRLRGMFFPLHKQHKIIILLMVRRWCLLLCFKVHGLV